MKQLKGNSIPTKKTKGALGDIYTDTSTGKKYKCVFSYRDNDDSDFDCQWKELSEETKPVTKSVVKEDVKPVTKSVVKEDVKPATKSVVKPAVEEKPVEKKKVKKSVAEEVKEEVKPKPHTGKTNYTAYSKKQ